MKTKIKDTRFFIRMNTLEDYLDIVDGYDAYKNLFKSKNEFLKICLLKGLQVVKDEVAEIDGMKKGSKKVVEDNLGINDKYMKLMVLLLSNIYEMLVGLSIGKPKTLASIKDGVLDDLPERFAVILKED